MNMDTGNTFIAGRDPVAFLKQFLKRVSHVHVKDVSESLAKAVRGGQTGIAVSHCALGEGVNAGNIKQCLALLRGAGYQGVLNMECEGANEPRSVKKSNPPTREPLSAMPAHWEKSMCSLDPRTPEAPTDTLAVVAPPA